MKRSVLVPLALFQFMLISFPVMADVSVSMRLDREEATIADSINIMVSIAGARESDSMPVLKGIEDFYVTQGGTSSRFEVINGQVNSGIDYSFFLQPKKTGTFVIGPVEIAVGGKTYRSNKATLKVVKQPESTGADRGPLFLTAGLSSAKVYVEEQSIYTLRLYHQTRVSNISLELPETEHLTFRQLGKPIEYRSFYNGLSYDVVEIRYVLIPPEEGIYKIEPSRMKMTVAQPERRSRRGFFDDSLFFSKGRSVAVASEPMELNVLPLPGEGKPSDFSGLVGSFKINSKLEPDTIKAGESATLTVFVSGRGNVNRIPDLKWPEPDHIKVYADEPVLEVKEDAEGLSGSKTMKWALVPGKEGRYKIPSLSLSFFDTKTNQYRKIETSRFCISALPGEVKQIQASTDHSNGQKIEGPVKKAVKELGHDILPIHASIKDIGKGSLIRPGGLVFWFVFIGPFFIYAVAFLGLKLRKRSGGSIALLTAKKAAKKFIKKCRQDGLSSNDLALCFRNYLNERFGLSLGSLTSEEAAEILKSEGVSLDTAQKIQAILKGLEDAVYTGKGQNACELREEASQLVRQIEKEIR
ncbi:MAG: protein BatD [Deltaproteobacteria bacterium]|nr:protein BatD [Deltaproteobacteria bacterium]MBW1931924.1 protein BatD [Deltaproteobacteria bacterium]MBW1937274.1 protein BatD [Deltaproteobacteria bacterium]MBW1963727.1 protein BatD [Deltaproteobacteria bacterium]MBW2080015.1 protein BatD [Deltaproteobacteria bacterium]